MGNGIMSFFTVDIDSGQQKPSPIINNPLDHHETENEFLLPTHDQEGQFHYDPPLSSQTSSLSNKWNVRFYLISFITVSSIGSFLLGYHMTVVSGAMLKVKEYFEVDFFWHQLIVTMMMAGMTVGAGLAGPLSEWIGRKAVLFLASLLYTLGEIILSTAPEKFSLTIGRFVVGVGCGLSLLIVPVFISESVPSHSRGKFLVSNIVFIVGGQVMGSVFSGPFSYIRTSVGWRLMFGSAIIPSTAMLIGLLFLVESPRWLIFHRKIKEGKKALAKLRYKEEIDNEMNEILEDFEDHQTFHSGNCASWKKFFRSRTVLLALLIGCSLVMIQQFIGINAIMFYSGSIINNMGFSKQISIWLTIIPPLTNFIFLFICLMFVDNVGRRKLMLISLLGIVVTLLLFPLAEKLILTEGESLPAKALDVVCDEGKTCTECVQKTNCGFCAIHNVRTGKYENGTCAPGIKSHSLLYLFNDSDVCQLYSDNVMENQAEYLHTTKIVRYYSFDFCPNSKYTWIFLLVMALYVMFFAIGLGPLPFSISAEIFPTWARGNATALVAITYSVSNLLVSSTFLTALEYLGHTFTYCLYAGFGIVGLLFVVLLLPETKGCSLEEIEYLFERPYFLQWCARKEEAQCS